MLGNLAPSSGYDTQGRNLSNIRKEFRSIKTSSELQSQAQDVVGVTEKKGHFTIL